MSKYNQTELENNLDALIEAFATAYADNDKLLTIYIEDNDKKMIRLYANKANALERVLNELDWAKHNDLARDIRETIELKMREQ